MMTGNIGQKKEQRETAEFFRGRTGKEANNDMIVSRLFTSSSGPSLLPWSSFQTSPVSGKRGQ